MEFRIADTFTDSLSRLTSDEQKSAKTTAFDLQVNPTGTGHGFHKLEKSRDKNFWSVKVNSDIRLIVHKTQNSFLLCYVDHHDKAYDWAERRKLETHPTTGAAQLVEVRETVTEVLIPVYKPTEAAPTRKPLLFENTTDEELLSYGVPLEWIADVKKADEDSLLLLADRLPAEAAEALIELATGGKPRVIQPATPVTNPFNHPDAQRRFRVMNNLDALKTALEYPWEKWTVFLHPEQQQWVDRAYNGPARVSGSAGTGKTIVALHRAVTLAKAHPDARVLLTTYSDTLANALHTKLTRLIGNEPRLAERIDAAGCPIVIMLNKWELIDDAEERERIDLEVKRKLYFVDDAPVLKVSALTGKGVHKLRPVLQEAILQYHRRIPTRDVNRVIADAQQRQAAGGGARVMYALQGATDPPTFTLFVNRELPHTYLRYLERSIREAFNFGSTPLKLRVRKRAD